MPKYLISRSKLLVSNITIEANNEEEAYEKAYNALEFEWWEYPDVNPYNYQIEGVTK